jgi:hypothetical protein
MRISLGVILGCAAACGHGQPASRVHDAGSSLDASLDGGGGCDEDLDGYESLGCGGDDCNNFDPAIHPGARDGATWEGEHVDDSVWGVALALDPAGSAHLHYRHGLETHEELRYATNAGERWLIEVQEPDTQTDPSSSIIADATGAVHLAYRLRTELDGWTLRYAKREGASWSVEVVEESAQLGSGVSMGIDSASAIRIAYHGDECLDACPRLLRDAENATGDWMISTPGDQASSAGASLAIDAAGNTLVSFADYGSRAPDVEVRALEVEAGTSSYVATADPPLNFAGYETRLALEPDSQLPHIVYGGGSLGHAWQADGAWSRERIDGLDDATDVPEVSLAVDEAGVVHVAFIVRSTADDGIFFDYHLRYARGHAGSWSIEDVDAWYAATPDVALALDSDGGVHVAYVGTDNELIYARRVEDDPIDHDCDGSELR